jgi:O-antigen/teichoic acid export membrane protein
MSAKDIAGGLLRSTGAATLSQVWRYGVAFLTRIVLRRLLAQGAWGVWHWAVDAVFGLLAQLRDLGLPAHIVRSRPRPYGNFLAVELIWGGVLGAGVLVLAPAIAGLFREAPPELPGVLRLLVLFFLFEGLARVPLTFFEAELAIEKALGPELARNLFWAVASIALALLGFGIWSLVIAHVFATGLFAALLWVRAWRQMPLTWVPGGTLPLVRAGLPLMVIATLYLLQGAVAFLILGWAGFSDHDLGRFGFGLELAFLVARVLELPIRRPLYPALVAFRDDPARFAETYRLATVLLLALLVPTALFLFVNAEALVVLLLGEEWVLAATYLRILAFALVLQPFGRAAEDVLLARNRERLVLAATAVNILVLAGLGVWLTARLGPVGMAWAHLFPVGELIVLWAIRQVTPEGFRRLLPALAWLYLVPALLFAAAALATPGGGWPRLAFSLLAGGVTVAVYLWRFGSGFLRFFEAGAEARGGDPTPTPGSSAAQ